jgi:hypothetical protein
MERATALAHSMVGTIKKNFLMFELGWMTGSTAYSLCARSASSIRSGAWRQPVRLR